jgi:UDP:flavonoid glycosyltransferase YjiC (YdhE family)
VFLLDNIPHDWLFPRVSCVVHHGGAGTTAIGLKCGKPTMIVPCTYRGSAFLHIQKNPRGGSS